MYIHICMHVCLCVCVWGGGLLMYTLTYNNDPSNL